MSRLSMHRISAGYGPVEVLRGVDLEVPSGAIVALLGANGAGKTTLLRLASGLLSPTTGDIHYDGRDLTRSRADQRVASGICLIPEGRGIFRDLSVQDNIAMFSGGGGVSAAVERAATAFPRLGERLSQRAGTMSGGEQQMLAVCRALVADFSLVMADELSVGLAPVIIDEILDAVVGLRDRGVSLLIVEQYVDRILAVADYVYVLHKGSIVFVGEPPQFTAGGVFEQYLGGAA